jgi:signal transduction histidine kinase
VLVLVVAAVSGAVTLAAALFPQLELVHWVPALHVAFETSGALIALLAGLLIAGRFLRRGYLTELTLVCSLGGLAVSELAFATVPVGTGHGSLSVWAALGGQAFGAVLFTLAMFLPGRRLSRPGLALGMGAALVAVTPLLIALGAVAFAPRLPGASVAASAGLAELGLALIYGLAAAGFLRRAERSHDEFDGWLAVAALLAGASHLNYFLYPGMYSQLISLGDVFRLCSYAVLLAGSAREISSYWQALPQAAALEERRRIARDLDDSLGRELAYLLRNLDSLDGTAATESGAPLRRAAERAQLAAQQAVSRLAGTRSGPEGGAIAAGNAGGWGWPGFTAYGGKAKALRLRPRLRPRPRPRVLFLAGTRPRRRGTGGAANYPDAGLIHRVDRLAPYKGYSGNYRRQRTRLFVQVPRVSGEPLREVTRPLLVSFEECRI